MPRALETNAGIANFLQTAEFFGLGLDFDVRLPELLAAVTLEQANAAARHALDPESRDGGDCRTVSAGAARMNVRAVFFDVDFTLIYPGPTFRSEGYRAFCERYGIAVDESKFDRAVADAAAAPRRGRRRVRRRDVRAVHAAHHRGHGRAGRTHRTRAPGRSTTSGRPAITSSSTTRCRACSERCRQPACGSGLISNSHRCLASFQSHFELRGLIAGAISGPEHGFMKPNPTIFKAALERVNVRAEESLMVGDSVRQDVEGALRTGMKAVLLHRAGGRHPDEESLSVRGVRVVHSLNELSLVLPDM